MKGEQNTGRDSGFSSSMGFGKAVDHKNEKVRTFDKYLAEEETFKILVSDD